MAGAKSKAKTLDERWSWTEKTEPDSITDHQLMKAYNLLLETCPLGACRANCRQNPCCLNGLGPDKFAETAEAATSLAAAAAAAAKSSSSSSADNESVNAKADNDDAAADEAADAAQSDDGPIGLTNYGNTCYLNSLLQLYLRSPELVQAVYRLPSEDDAIIRELQSIFARLQLQHGAVCEPLAFIEALNLDKSIQQDASEFRVLFRQLLERRFDQCGDNVMKTFTGSYRYVTRCQTCQYQSEQESSFHELCLNLTSPQLTECLREFLSHQNLSGENQYNCPVCQAPSDASIGVELLSLPEELCLQLMRFDFDMRTLRKKKVKLPIVYPELLDMAEFLPGSEPYILKAVLIHIGPQATGGHYVALVRDYTRGWIVCNDSQVYRVKHKLLKRQEEKLEQSMGYSASRLTEKASVGLPGKDWHLSQNAYILVYERRSVFESHRSSPPSLASVPAGLANQVLAENAARARLISAEARRERRHRDFLGGLASRILPHLQRVDCHAFVPSTWLQTIFNSAASDLGESSDSATYFQRSLESCSYTQYLCPHSCLLPDSVGPHIKAVSREMFDFLSVPTVASNDVTNNNASAPTDDKDREDDVASIDSIVTPVPAPFLAGESALCLACVRQRCARIRLDARLTADAKIIDKAAKKRPEYHHAAGQDSSTRSAWVGTKSLRSWKNIARQQLQQQHQQHQQQQQQQQEYSESTSGPTSIPTRSDSISAAGEDDNTNIDDGSTLPTDGVSSSGQLSGSNLVQSSLSNGATAVSTVNFAFNEDLLCQHGNLCCETGRRRLLNEEVWQRLAAYFPGCPTYWHDAQPCPTCSEQRSRLASRAKAESDALFHLSAHLKRHRPGGGGPHRQLSVTDCGGRIYYADVDFLALWRRFVASAAAASAAEEESTTTPLAEPPEGPVPNSHHLCQHGGLQCRPDSVDSGLVALAPSEWLALVEAYKSDGVEIYRLEDDTCQPDVCKECCNNGSGASTTDADNDDAAAAPATAGADNVFKMTIYVRVADDSSSARLVGAAFGTRSSVGGSRKRAAAASASSTSESAAAADSGDADSNKNDDINDEIKSPPAKCAKGEHQHQQQQPWRSARIRRKPTDRRFDVASDATVQDLKLLLMEAYGVAPYDQHLLIEGRELEPAKAQLMQLGLTPYSVVDAAFDLPPGAEDAASAAVVGGSGAVGGPLRRATAASMEAAVANSTEPAELEVGFSGTRLFESALARPVVAKNGVNDDALGC